MFHRIIFSVCFACLGMSSVISAQETGVNDDAKNLASTHVRVDAESVVNQSETVSYDTMFQAIEMKHRLELLRKRRQRLGLNFGEGHPKILELNEAIASLTQKLEDSVGSEDWLEGVNPASLDVMQDGQWREIVSQLTKRVWMLEMKVNSLRESPEIFRQFPK